MPDLINTLEAPGEFDALSSLRPGEPYFLLVGRDRLAPPLIDQWADGNRRRALADYGEGKMTLAKRTTELRKSTEAEMIAASMVSYKSGWADEAPRHAEMPSTTANLPDETLLRDRLQSLRARAATALSNAHAEVVELREFMMDWPHAFDGEQERLLSVVRKKADGVRELADAITMPRPGIPR